jgi:hypothetical protein
MEHRTRRVSRRWRTAAVLALGAIIGTMLVAQPAGAHFLPSITHIWSHIKAKADPRYANAVRGTDKAKNADKLDGLDSTRIKGRWAIVEANGTITAQSGGITLAAHAVSGEYYLDFGENLANNGVAVSQVWRSGAGFPGTVLAAVCATAGVTCIQPGTNNNNTIYVQTNNAGNTADVDHAFSIVVVP